MSKQFRSIEHQVIFNKLQKGLRSEEQLIEPQSVMSPDSHQSLFGINGYIRSMTQTRENHAYRHIHSERKFIGPLIVFGKKVVRKLLKWYIEPVTFQQTKFNNAVTPALVKMTELVKELSETTNEITSKLDTKQIEYDRLVMQFDQKEEHQKLLLENIEQMKKDFENKINFLEKKLNIQQEQIEQIEQIDATTKGLDRIGLLKNVDDSIYNKRTHSQSGEDSILAYILHVVGIPIEEVDYIDLGANHAKELSNTYYLYSKGAKGILVEANSELIPELRLYRHRDVILNKCVDVESGKKINFYVLNGDGLSTTDEEAAKAFCEINPALKIVANKEIETISYAEIVEQYLGKAPTILSVDIEGNELEILKSIDYENSRPLIIVTEMISYDLKLSHHTKNASIKEFLEIKDYDEYAFTGINSIFIDRRFLSGRENKNEYSN